MTGDLLTPRARTSCCPNDWRDVPLGQVADIRFSSVDKLNHASEEPVRLCNYTDVYNNSYISDDLDFMRASATDSEIERFSLQIGDVIITKDSETPDDIGVAAVVDHVPYNLVCGYHLALIRPNPDEVDPTFLAKQMGHSRLARYFGRQANGLTRYGLPLASVQRAPAYLPQPHEQKAVGAILRSVDEAIRNTEAVIAKLKQVRAGLVHDLLTRGLDANGQLRDLLAHPEQFQESAIGRMPREWKVEPLGILFEMQLGKMLSPRARAGTSARPYLANRHVLWDQVNCRDLEHMDFTPAERLRYALRVGDLLVCEGGEVGRTAIWRGEVAECYFQKAIHRLRALGNLILPEYMVAFMRRTSECGGFVNLTSQTSIAHLTQEKLALLPVARPPIVEQEKMVALWSTIDSYRQVEDLTLEKMRYVKSGLMNDLLTGCTRVPESLFAAEERR